jgi:hypothetical protein
MSVWRLTACSVMLASCELSYYTTLRDTQADLKRQCSSHWPILVRAFGSLLHVLLSWTCSRPVVCCTVMPFENRFLLELSLPRAGGEAARWST